MPRGLATRFAPAPTGHLHLGHVANALWVWGVARATDGRILLRIEDHDRQRSRPAYDAAILEDLAWLGFAADDGPIRQATAEAGAAHDAALARLHDAGLAYACTCTRATFAAWAAEHGARWTGPGCPDGCRGRALLHGPGTVVRVALDDGVEAFDDLRLGSQAGPVSPDGDPVVRDRHGGGSYLLTVVDDDLRHGIGLVIRGEDLLAATPAQVRLGRLLGREAPARFLHHPLIRKPGGAKLSKSDGDTGIRELRAAGWSVERVLDEAARRGAVDPAVRAAAVRPGRRPAPDREPRSD